MTASGTTPVDKTLFRAFSVGMSPPTPGSVSSNIRRAHVISVANNTGSVESQIAGMEAALSGLARTHRAIYLVWPGTPFFLRDSGTRLAIYNGSSTDYPDNRPVMLAALRSGTLDLGAQPDRRYGMADNLTTVQRLAPVGASLAAMSPAGIGSVITEGANEYAYIGLDVIHSARLTSDYRAFIDAISDRDGFARLDWTALAAETAGSYSEMHPAELTHAMNIMHQAIERCLIDAGWFTAQDLVLGAAGGGSELVVFNAGLGSADVAKTTTGWVTRAPRTNFRHASSYLYQLRVDKATGGILADQSLPLLEAQALEMAAAFVDASGALVGDPRHKVNIDGGEAGGLTTALQIAATKRSVRALIRAGQSGLVFWSAGGASYDNAEHTSVLGEFNTVFSEELPSMAALDPTTLSSAKFGYFAVDQQNASGSAGTDGSSAAPFTLCRYTASATTDQGDADYNEELARLKARAFNGANATRCRAIAQNEFIAPTVSQYNGQHIAWAHIPSRGGPYLLKENGTSINPANFAFTGVVSKTANKASFSGSVSQPDEPMFTLIQNDYTTRTLEVGQDGATGCWYTTNSAGTKTVTTIPCTADKQAVVISSSGTEIFIRVSGNLIATLPTTGGSAGVVMRLNANQAATTVAAGWNWHEALFHDAALTSGQSIDIITHLSRKYGITERTGTVIMGHDSWAAGQGTACANDTICAGVANQATRLRVVNKGVSGLLLSGADSIKAQYTAAALRTGDVSTDPWALVLMGAMNHIWPTTPANSDTPSQIAAWVDSVAAAVHAAGGKVVFVTTPTVCLPAWIESTFTTQNTRRIAINDAVKALGSLDLVIDLDDSTKHPGWAPTPLADSPTATQVFTAARTWVEQGTKWRLKKQTAPVLDHVPVPGSAGVEGIHLGLGQTELGELIGAEVESLLFAAASDASATSVRVQPLLIVRR